VVGAAPAELREVRNIRIRVAKTLLVIRSRAPIAAEELTTVPAGEAHVLVVVVDTCLLPR
jgi:hypothetical protein